MDTEQITYEIQQAKAAKTPRSNPAADSITTPSIADTTLTEDDGKSMASLQSDSGIHASQIAVSPSLPTTAEEGEQQQPEESTTTKSRRTKRQLWDDLIISCE